jgi:histidyl-tRNA synthetase
MGSMKSQFKRADSSGAAFALIFGADELANNTLIVKSLRNGSGAQVIRSLSNVDEWATTLQSLT